MNLRSALPGPEVFGNPPAFPPDGARPATAVRKIRVGVFGDYYPDYRHAVFARMSQHPDFEFTFHADSPPSGSFIRASDSKPYTYRSIAVSSIPIRGTRNSITYRWGQLSALLRRRFDVLIVTNDILAPDIWLSCLLSHVVRVPVCIWGQGLSRPPSRLRNALRHALTSLAKAAVYYSEGGKHYWVQRGISADKLFVAYNALDTDEQFRIRNSLTESAIRELLSGQGLAGKKIVTYLGRLIAAKKPVVFIDSVARAAQEEPELVGLLIGDGPQRQELERRGRELGISHALRFTGEVYDEGLLARYLSSSVAVVLPAAAGLAIQHAAVYGVPLILGDIPNDHLPEQEIVQEGETGLWCPDEDVEAFAAAILRLTRDPAFRQSLSRNAMRIIEEKYNVANMAQGFIDALHYCVRPSERGVVP